MTSSPSKKMSSNIQLQSTQTQAQIQRKGTNLILQIFKKIEQKQHYSLTLLCNKNSNETRKKASFLPWVIYFLPVRIMQNSKKTAYAEQHVSGLKTSGNQPKQ